MSTTTIPRDQSFSITSGFMWLLFYPLIECNKKGTSSRWGFPSKPVTLTIKKYQTQTEEHPIEHLPNTPQSYPDHEKQGKTEK